MTYDLDVSAEHHYRELRLHGEPYLSKVLRRSAPPVTRQRLLTASLRYLELTSRSVNSAMLPSQLSQASQGLMLSRTVAINGPISSFQSLLASVLDQDIAVEALIDACVKAADCQVLPVLVKCLFILSAIRSIRDDDIEEAGKEADAHLQGEGEDEELFGAHTGNEENVDPQADKPKMLKNVNPRPLLGKRKESPREISVGRTGQAFVDEFVSRLVADSARKSTSQGKATDVFVATVAKEAPLSPTASRNVLRLLTRRMRGVDIFELPPFIYQLLLFASSKGTSAAKSEVLMQITKTFAGLEARIKRMEAISQNLLEEDEDAILTSSTTLSDFRQVQGTALLHIEYAVKQDPWLSAEIFKLAKSGIEIPRQFMSSFGAGIMLSLARSTSAQSDILQILRESVLRYEREMSLRDSNLYAARVTMNDERVVDPGRSLLQVAECTSETGWDNVKESLVSFALLLLDRSIVESSTGSSDCPTLGEKLLCKLFQAHPSIRQSILEQLTTRIALQEKSVYIAISVIRSMALEKPFDVLEHSQCIRDGIEMLPMFPPWIASALTCAYKPLLSARQDLRDYFQLVIRKSLFHRSSSSRAVAIDGFLVVLSLASSHTRRGRTGCSSVNPGTVSDDIAGVDDESLEAVQPLRRIFSYAAPLRALLYKRTIQNLQDVERNAGSRMAAALDDVLRSHLQTFVTPRDAPYLVVEHCVNEAAGGILVEPLGDLIWCLAVVEYKRDPKLYSQSYIIDLARKLASTSIQDFPVAKQTLTVRCESGQQASELTDAHMAEEASARANRNQVRVLGSVCEALINAILIVSPEAQDWSLYAEALVPLLTLKGKFFDLLRSAGMSSPGDAFADLGGDFVIERLRPGMRMYLQRGTKSAGQKGTKASGNRKSKVGDGAPGSGQVNNHATEHRFGCFAVLSSASSKPRLPLHVAMRTLRLMSDASNQVSSSSPNVFRGQAESRDFQDLRRYLLAVLQKHIGDYVTSMAKDTVDQARGTNAESTIVGCAVGDLVQMAMNDFKQCRSSSSSANVPSGLSALQIVERCAFSLTFAAGRNKASVVAFCNSLMPSAGLIERQTAEETFEAATEALEKLVESLIEDESLREASLTLQVYDSLVRSVVKILGCISTRSSFQCKRAQWAMDMVVVRQVRDSGIVCMLVKKCLVYTENNNDLRRAGQLCRRLLEVIGDCDENAELPQKMEADEEKLCSAMSVQQETSLGIVDVILDVVERAICDVEWCLGRMLSLESSVGNSSVEVDSAHCGENSDQDDDVLQQQATAKQAIRAEDAAQVRLEGVVRTLACVARCAIGKWAQQERLLKLITKAYKAICTATQAQAKRRGDPRTTFTSLIDECKGLAPTVWTYLAFVGSEAYEERAGKGPSKAAREARVMPQLIYEVERFEKVLIAAQKRTKINLLRGMRRNIARDFRIREDLLHAEESLADNEENGQMDEQVAASRAQGRPRVKKRRK